MENQETYLAAWFEGRMTDEELQQIISSEEFLHYQQLKNALSGLELQTPGTESHFQAIKDKLAKTPVSNTRVVPMWRYVAVAASIVMLIGLSVYFSIGTLVHTQYGKSEVVTLADHSVVHLGANSQLSYTNFFKFSRNIELKGEAYFEVAKGSRFTVDAPQGSVSVLGTKFNVVAGKTYLEVHCDEGKVSVKSAGKEIILTPGKSVSFYNGNMSQWGQPIQPVPEASQRETSFYKTPAEAVFEKIENQYGVKITYPSNVSSTSFSGAIPHDDINVAMQSVCLPLHLKYTQAAGKITVANE